MPSKTPTKLLFSWLILLLIWCNCCRARLDIQSTNNDVDETVANVDYNNNLIAAKNSNKVNGMFVFGSSLVDNGNNNYLTTTLAKADYLPYGVDFPLGPTGRFTNGKNVIDLFGQHLGLQSSIPPFLDPSTKGDRIVHGVNYASGGSGIRDDTKPFIGHVVGMNLQIKAFEGVTMADLEMQLGKRGEEALRNYLFVVGTAGNDYSFTYFANPLVRHQGVQAFTNDLIFRFTDQLKKLYQLGGRKFVIMSVYPLGCYPNVRIKQPHPNDGCNIEQNNAAQLFNNNVKKLIDNLKQELPDSHYVFVNVFKIITDIINNPSSKGFVDVTRSCCDVTSIIQGRAGSLCRRGGQVCQTRNGYVFFDGLHPTEAINTIIAQKAFETNDLVNEVYPMNINQLVQI